NRLVHRNPGIGSAIAHEATCTAIHRFIKIDLQASMHLAAKAHFGVCVRLRDAGPAFAKACRHFLSIIADAGDDTEPRDDHSSHDSLSFTMCGTYEKVRGDC